MVTKREVPQEKAPDPVPVPEPEPGPPLPEEIPQIPEIPLSEEVVPLPAILSAPYFDDSSSSRFGTGDGRILDVSLRDHLGQKTTKLLWGKSFSIDLTYKLSSPLGPIFGLGFYRDEGIMVSGPNTQSGDFSTKDLPLEGTLRYQCPQLSFLPGKYHLSIALYDTTGSLPFDHLHKFLSFDVVDDTDVPRHGLVEVQAEWGTV